MSVYTTIIVGGGTAGCVLANRLSADPDNRVLLLEAGPRADGLLVQMPGGFFGRHDKAGALVWGFETEAEQGLEGRRIPFGTGRGLGGSSAIGSMLHVRGAPEDFDGWRDGGLPGWGFADVLPYFKRAEDFAAATPYRGGGGPMKVSPASPRPTLARVFLAAAAELGLPRNADFHGPSLEGVGSFATTVHLGERWSAARGYLGPAKERPNLTVLTDAFVQRIDFAGTRARGVRYALKDKIETAVAEGEVIICAGSVRSPQLLMLSGIGPADHLRSLGIDVIADVAGVGQNLQDHLVCPVLVESVQPVSLFADQRPDRRALAALQYVLFGTGRAAELAIETGGFLRSDADARAPDLGLEFVPAFVRGPGMGGIDRHGMTILVGGLRPRSRGTVRLRAKDPEAAPVIAPRYLSAPEDLATLVRGVRLAREIFAQRAFDAYRGRGVVPLAEERDEAALAAVIRREARSAYHAVGTCRMGADAGAVVDPGFRVNGVDGLRVVDASVMPSIVSAHPAATVLMLAEKAADVVLGRVPLAPEDPRPVAPPVADEPSPPAPPKPTKRAAKPKVSVAAATTGTRKGSRRPRSST